ncbi:caspase-10-like [Ornithodoros turicata]|uniref:caspase-10-like n=1 Tax=Ornithodoros turicata TaxID=34597 RepID=UPI00313A1C48
MTTSDDTKKKTSMSSRGSGSGGLELSYNMKNPKRGLCVILDVQNPGRSSCTKDARNVRSAFQYLGFNCTVHSTPTAATIQKILTEASTWRDNAWSDCFVCLLLTPGKNGDMLVEGDQKFTTDMLTKYFVASSCRSLKDKPKLFFVQIYEDMEEVASDDIAVYDMTIPAEFDFFLCYDVSKRSNSGRKSNLIQAVDSLLRDTVAPYQAVELQDIVRKAARMVSQASTTSCYMSTLRRRVVFSVKQLAR